MKRLIWIMLALFLPCAAIAQEALYSISEVAAMTPAYWEVTCEPDRNGGISFKAPIYVPDVDRMPIIRAKYQQLPPDKAADFAGIDFDNVVSYQHFVDYADDWSGKGSFGATMGVCLNNLWSDEPRQTMHQVYADNQRFSLGDVADGIERFMDEYYGVQFIPRFGFTGSAYYQRNKDRQITDELFECGSLTGLGQYDVEGWMAVDGVPVLEHIGGIQERQGGRVGDMRRAFSGGAYFVWASGVFSKEHYSLYCSYIPEKVEYEIDDVPLCSFDTVRQKVQAMLDQGDIRNVYAAELGYMIYADPETKYADEIEAIGKQEFLLVPVWMVEVSRTKSAAGRETESFDSDGCYVRLDTGYENLCFNAQTGELLNGKCWNAQDTATLYPQKILTWDDVL